MSKDQFFSGNIDFEICGSEKVLKRVTSCDFFTNYIPGLAPSGKDYTDYKIYLSNSKNLSDPIKIDSKEATLGIADFFSDKDIISLIDYVLEFWRQTVGVYTIHGSSCHKNGQAILMIGGASGIGKSTLVYNVTLPI